MTSPTHPTNGSAATPTPPAEQEVSMLDILLVLTRHQRIIVRSVIVCGALALLFAIFAPSQYTAWSKVIREVENDAMSRNMGSLSLLRGFGLNLGGATTGLTATAYPEIAMSREVRLAVVRDTFYFPDVDARMTFAAYSELEPGIGEMLFDYTIGLPRTLKRFLRRYLIPSAAGTGGAVLEHYPTREEEEAMKEISELVSIGVDEESGLMTLAARTDNPLLSAQLAQSFVDHLVTRVREIRTKKSREDLLFIAQQFKAAEDSLKQAENALAAFDDRNVNPRSARLRTERDGLLRHVSFKSELYSDLQAQLTQAEIDLQRSEPVITVLEQPVPPMESSGPQRTLTLILGLVVGFIAGIGLAFFQSFLEHQRADASERGKLEEIQQTLRPGAWLRRLPFRTRRKAIDR
ncbi:MAG: GNVR domain-containing protein [Rhodothermales bacterium]